MAGRSKKGQQTAFNLSFLDIMFCGFGAVVLLVLIVSGNTLRDRQKVHEDLRAELELLTDQVEAAKALVASLEAENKAVIRHEERLRQTSTEMLQRIAALKGAISRNSQEAAALDRKIKELEGSLTATQQRVRKKQAESHRDQKKGNSAVSFTGRGRRQYLTGLKLGGKRVLIMLDSSASMLDSTIVGIIRLRNMSPSVIKRSWKWRQARRTLRWLLANLPPESSVRVMTFSDQTTLVGPSSRRWIPSTDAEALEAVMKGVDDMVPRGGTSLYRPFAEASTMERPPDNIILLTDGLPTLGAGKPSGAKITSGRRLKLFAEAVKRLPRNVPVNVILFPLEGDPMAASSFWKLAYDTKGCLLTPARDWP